MELYFVPIWSYWVFWVLVMVARGPKRKPDWKENAVIDWLGRSVMRPGKTLVVGTTSLGRSAKCIFCR